MMVAMKNGAFTHLASLQQTEQTQFISRLSAFISLPFQNCYWAKVC